MLKVHHIFDAVFQLPDIAGPAVLLQETLRSRLNAGDIPVELLIVFFDEIVNEKRNILPPFTQRRNPQGNDAQAVIEILPEFAADDELFKILVGRRNDVYIHRDQVAAADSVDLPVGKHPQDLGLQIERHVPDFVKKQGAGVGEHELADSSAPLGAGKRPFLVTEKLAFQQRFGDGGAVDRHKGAGTSRPACVDGARNDLFAGAAFPEQQNIGRVLRHRLNLLLERQHLRIAGHQIKGEADGVVLDDGVLQSRKGIDDAERILRVVGDGAHRKGQVVAAPALPEGQLLFHNGLAPQCLTDYRDDLLEAPPINSAILIHTQKVPGPFVDLQHLPVPAAKEHSSLHRLKNAGELRVAGSHQMQQPFLLELGGNQVGGLLQIAQQALLLFEKNLLLPRGKGGHDNHPLHAAAQDNGIEED